MYILYLYIYAYICLFSFALLQFKFQMHKYPQSIHNDITYTNTDLVHLILLINSCVSKITQFYYTEPCNTNFISIFSYF